jgi:hypothetical protein
VVEAPGGRRHRRPPSPRTGAHPASRRRRRGRWQPYAPLPAHPQRRCTCLFDRKNKIKNANFCSCLFLLEYDSIGTLVIGAHTWAAAAELLVVLVGHRGLSRRCRTRKACKRHATPPSRDRCSGIFGELDAPLDLLLPTRQRPGLSALQPLGRPSVCASIMICFPVAHSTAEAAHRFDWRMSATFYRKANRFACLTPIPM